jgi:hypothetical protein
MAMRGIFDGANVGAVEALGKLTGRRRYVRAAVVSFI